MSRRKQSNPRQIKRKFLCLLLLLLFVWKPSGVKLDEREKERSGYDDSW